jgi:hypothetical protein
VFDLNAKQEPLQVEDARGTPLRLEHVWGGEHTEFYRVINAGPDRQFD